ncbi:MAG TPA: radical SAM family heme chaperone HemW [Candidatus Omnitrophota bacterium]|nr:radical SAM family heme chaperone HemW [Candidatus Omnitrophota bacterium]
MDYGLYVHLPYCRSLCPYCAFSKAPLHHAQPERLLSALAREWELAAAEAPGSWVLNRPRTIFVGGGTPTALDETTLAAFLDWVRSTFSAARIREWTVEANPEGLTAEKLRLLRVAGVDRLSLGVQSFEAEALRALGRIHTARGALDALARARAAGFTNVSLDLMAGVPGETAEGFARGVGRVIALGVPHLSIYALQVEEGTPLAAKAARGAIAIPGDDEAAERYDVAGRLLSAAGYHRYEVSSWALPGFESRHNQSYWIRRPYLGLGPGAHSFDGSRRWGNEEDVARWFDRVEAGELPRHDVRALSDADAREEVVFLGLRRARGLRRAALDRAAPREAEGWVRWGEAAGALTSGQGTVRPTERGLMTALESAAELFARAEAGAHPRREAGPAPEAVPGGSPG